MLNLIHLLRIVPLLEYLALIAIKLSGLSLFTVLFCSLGLSYQRNIDKVYILIISLITAIVFNCFCLLSTIISPWIFVNTLLNLVQDFSQEMWQTCQLILLIS